MSVRNTLRTRGWAKAGLGLAGALAIAAVVGWNGSSRAVGDAPALGQAPLEWAANADTWPAHNHDLDFKSGTGGLTAVDVATGKVVWEKKLPSENFGGATVANDVVFTSDYAGTGYAYDTATGKVLWSATTPAGINSFPAIDEDTLLVGAAGAGFKKNPQFQLIAYSLQ